MLSVPDKVRLDCILGLYCISVVCLVFKAQSCESISYQSSPANAHNYAAYLDVLCT